MYKGKKTPSNYRIYPNKRRIWDKNNNNNNNNNNKTTPDKRLRPVNYSQNQKTLILLVLYGNNNIVGKTILYRVQLSDKRRPRISSAFEAWNIKALRHLFA